jgi:nitrogen PTS system EIIA component
MLDIKQVARLLAVSDKTVYRWVAKGDIPAYRIGDGYRFNRVELLEWANARRIRVSHEIFEEPSQTVDTLPSLAEVIGYGGIHYRVQGADRLSVLESIVSMMHLPEDVDRAYLAQALLARENLGTTAIGDGVAIPHVRNPVIFSIDQPVIALCFLETPIDFSALDGKPVDTVFTIVTHTVRSHLHLLSRLSYALHQPAVRAVIAADSSRQHILDTLRDFESSLARKGEGN